MKKLAFAMLVLVVVLGMAVGAGAEGDTGSVTLLPMGMSLDDFFTLYNKTRGNLPELVRQNEVYVEDVSGKNNVFIETKMDSGADIVVQFSINNDGMLCAIAPMVNTTSSISYDLLIATCDQVTNVLMPDTEMVKRQAAITRLMVSGVKDGDFATYGYSNATIDGFVLKYSYKDDGGWRQILIGKYQ